MRRPASIVRHSVVQIHSSLLTLTLCSLVITAMVCNVTEYFLHVVIAQFMCHIHLAYGPWNEVKRFLIVVLTTVTRCFASAHCWLCIWKQCTLHLSFESALFCVASINYACEWYSDLMDGFLFYSEWELRVWFSPDRKSFNTFLLYGKLMCYFRKNVYSELKHTASFGTWRVRHFLNIWCSDLT
jgi:hypothetical protein